MKKFIIFIIALVFVLIIATVSFSVVRDDNPSAKYNQVWKETWASWEIFYPTTNLECIVVAVKDDPKYSKKDGYPNRN